MRSHSFASLALLGLVLAAPAHAAWPHDPNVGNVPLCTAAGFQLASGVVPDGAGGAIAVWVDYRSGTESDIYAQRVSASGAPLWTADGVPICVAGSYQNGAVVAPDGSGGAIIAWHDDRGATTDIYVQRVDASGTAQWAANGVALCTATGTQYLPAITSDGAGGAVVSWVDERSAAGSDIYAQRINSAGVVQWAANGVALCTVAGAESGSQVVSDGAGGAIVSWEDYRSGADYDVYAQRVNAAGVVQWTSDGVALAAQAGSQFGARLIPDGFGGAIAAWPDSRGLSYDIYAQRVNATGARLWNPGGIAVCSAASIQYTPTLCSDGAGGAIIAWRDERNGNYDVYAQRISAGAIPMWAADGIPLSSSSSPQEQPAIVADGSGGAVVGWVDRRYGAAHLFAQRLGPTGSSLWNYDGVALSLALYGQWAPQLVTDGAGGAIAVFEDYRNNLSESDIYAQRVERFGQLGNPEPTIVKVRDVRNDQGGKVELQWSASYLDVAPNNPIGSYWVWRQVPTLAAQARLARGAALLATPDAAAPPAPGALRASAEGAHTYYWEFLGSQTARGYPGYSYTATTLSDSVPGSNPYTLFMVEAEHAWSGGFWSSAPDSGYSVDNLPPTAPAPVAGTYSGGAASLHWAPNPEGDLAVYRLYRGTSAAFVPGPSNLVATPTDTAYSDPAGALYWYKLSALDVHGNESAFTTLLPSGTTDAGAAHVTELAFAPPTPNPARGATTLRFALPREGAVRLSVYDAAGRRVRVLADGVSAAGVHAVPWDLRDDAGRAVGAGLYFARLEAARQLLVRRIAATR